MFRFSVSGLLCALLAGCLTVPAAHDAEIEAHGPTPRDADTLVRAYYRRIFVHPDSIEGLKVSPPKKVWVGQHFDGAAYGHLVCTTLRAKSDAGAPVDVRDGLLIRDDAVVLRVAGGDWFGRRLC